MGPMEDPVRVGVQALHTFNASKSKATWAALACGDIVPPLSKF